MAEVKLFCAVYGERTAFSVMIALDASVYALQKAIAETLSTKQRTIVPRYLTLYLARKNGGWLQGDDDKVCAYLRGKVDKQLKRMHSWWMLNNADYFGSNFTPGRGKIHVLVELPEDAVAVVSKQPTLSQMIKVIHEQVVQTKRKRYVHSKMNSSKGHELLRELNIKVQPVSRASLATEVSTPVEAFKWESIFSEDDREITHFEGQQRERYCAYVENNIGEVQTHQGRGGRLIVDRHR